MAERRENASMPTVGELMADNDLIVLVADKGQAGAAFMRVDGKIIRAPYSVEVDYAEKPWPALTMRRVKVTVGWTKAQWPKEPPPTEDGS